MSNHFRVNTAKVGL